MRIALLLSCLCLMPTLVFGQSVDTLEKIRQSKQIAIGVRINSLPFSTLTQGNPTGYSVDLCNKVLDSMRKELKLSDLKVRYVPVTAADRIAKLKSGDIDIECGATVNTKSRQADAAFSYSTFFAGEKLLVRAGSNIQNVDALGGRTIAVVKGTTAEKMFAQIRDGRFHNLKLVSYNSLQEAFNAVEAGTADALAQTDVLTESVRVNARNPDAFVMTQQAMSVEPMGLMVRKNDKALLSMVDRTLTTLYSSGEINTIYDRWFNTATYKMPMSMMLRDGIVHPNREPAVALGLGYQL